MIVGLRDRLEGGRTRRRLLLLLLLLLLVVVGAGVGGFVPGFGPSAPQEPSPTDTPTDDRLELTFEGDAVLLDYEDLAPGAAGNESVTLSNDGTVAGNVSISSIDVTENETGIVGGEAAVDGTPASGELAQHLRLAIAVTYPNGTTVALYGTGDGPRPVTALAAIDERSASGVVPAGETATVTVDWVLPAETGDVVQSDAADVAVSFELRAEES